MNFLTILFFCFSFLMFQSSTTKPKLHGLISGAEGNACIIKGDIPYCWGPNDGGVNGYYVDNKVIKPYAYPPKGLEDGGVTKIDLPISGIYGCAIKNGAAWCWGESAEPLGFGEYGRAHKRPRVVPLLDKGVIDIATGSRTACAVKKAKSKDKSGALYCWGDTTPAKIEEHHKQLAKGLYVIPVASASSGVTKVSMRYETGCIIKDEEVYCWGFDIWAQVGRGIEKGRAENWYRHRLNKVVGLPKGIVDIASIDAFACALTKKGEIYCWGLFATSAEKHGSGFMDMYSLKERAYFVKKYKDKLQVEDEIIWYAPVAVKLPKYENGSDIVRFKGGDDYILLYKRGLNTIADHIGSHIGVFTPSKLYKLVDIAFVRVGCQLDSNYEVSCISAVNNIFNRDCFKNRCESSGRYRIDFATPKEIKAFYKDK